MSSLCIKGAEVVTALEVRVTNVFIEGSQIKTLSDELLGMSSDELLAPDSGWQVLDGSGCYLTPGLIDLQVNGSSTCNLWADPTLQQFQHLRQDLLQAGVTTFLPTLITDELKHVRKNVEFLTQNGVADSQQAIRSMLAGKTSPKPSTTNKPAGSTNKPADSLARVPGIHLEGPFLSPERPGVHPPQWLQPISTKVLTQLVSPHCVLMTLAPELEDSASAITFLIGQGVKVAIGHSNASFAEAQNAFALGVDLMTHTFNALPPLHHRAPGAVAAALLDDSVSCTVIADGLHLHPAAVELILRCKGTDKTILISDAAYEGTSQGQLVGSSITVADAVRNVVDWRIASFAQAITMASYNPAAALGLQDALGNIAPGAKADLLLWDKQNLRIKKIIFDGHLLKD